MVNCLDPSLNTLHDFLYVKRIVMKHILIQKLTQLIENTNLSLNLIYTEICEKYFDI